MTKDYTAILTAREAVSAAERAIETGSFTAATGNLVNVCKTLLGEIVELHKLIYRLEQQVSEYKKRQTRRELA